MKLIKNRSDGRVLASGRRPMRPYASGIAAVITTSLVACAHLGLHSKKSSKDFAVTSEQRLAAIQRAQVWTPTNVPAMNLRVGPQVAGAFPPGADVTCNYLNKAMSGNSPKFACLVPPNDELKVKYGRANGEV